MWVELLIVIAFYIYVLYLYTYLKKKYIIEGEKNSSYKRVMELKKIPIKNMKEQMEYFELTQGGNVFKSGFGKFLISIVFFIILGMIIRLIDSVYVGIGFVLVYGILISFFITRKSDLFEYNFFKTMFGFLFIGCIFVLARYFSLSINFLLLLVILYIIYLVFNKWFGVEI